MKKVVMIVSAGMMMAAGSVLAGGSASLDLASAYVFRGVTFNDGLVLQPGVKVAEYGVTLGAWGNLDLDDYAGAVAENQFSEIDLYGSYALPVEAADISVGYTEYTYPGAEGEADREVSLSIGLKVLASPSVAVYYGVDGGIDKTLYIEGAVGHELELGEGIGLKLGATVGYVDPDGGTSGFSHFTAKAGLSYACLAASVTYIGQIDEEVLPDGAGAYDAEVVGVIGVSGDL